MPTGGAHTAPYIWSAVCHNTSCKTQRPVQQHKGAGTLLTLNRATFAATWLRLLMALLSAFTFAAYSAWPSAACSAF